MTGQQHLHKQQNGKCLLNLLALVLLICISLLGCADQIASLIPGPGRADWEIQLSENYYLIRENSRSKKICKSTDISGVYTYVLPNYYVTKYYVSEPYICVEGIPTEENFASNVEQTSDNYRYYLLDVRDGNLYGPYDAEDFFISDLLKNFNVSVVWEKTPR